MGDKQTQAVICNFKEQSRLEKAIQMLQIEEAYALSLINLDSKVLKIGYKRLKDRVAKTKSHLTNDQINEMKALEEKGELKHKVIKMESDIRIAAAEKRLKLWSDEKARSITPRVKTAKARLETVESVRSVSPGASSMHSMLDARHFKDRVRKSIDIRDSVDAMEASFQHSDTERAKSSMHIPVRKASVFSNNADETFKSKRRVSIRTDAFMRSPEEPLKRQKSIEIRVSDVNHEVDEALQYDEESKPIQKHVMKPTNTERNLTVPGVSKSSNVRPQTGHPSVQSRKSSFLKKRPSTSVIPASRDRSNKKKQLSKLIGRTPFSSHDLDKTDKKSPLDTPFRSIREGTLTAHDEKTIDKDMGEEIYKAIKKEFLRKEAITSLHIEDKIDNFYERVDDYVNERDKTKDWEVKIHVPIFSRAAREVKKSPPRRNHLRRYELELAVRENVADDKLQAVFKDMHKNL